MYNKHCGLRDGEYNLRSNPRTYAATLQLLRRDHLRGIHHGLLELLRLTRTHRCSSKHDRIYSLLSLLLKSDRDNELLQVDSTKSPAEVYASAAQYIITKSKNLQILSYISPDSTSDIQKVQTWVPHWDSLRSPLLDFNLYTADAGLPKACKYEFSKHGRKLIVDGFRVDTIENIIIIPLGVENWRSLVPSINSDMIKQIPEGQSSIEACWRTMLGDQLVDDKGHRHRICKDTRFVGDDCSQPDQLQALDPLRNRCIFYTKKGFIGYTESGARWGDIVVILPGARIPLVARLN